MPRQTWRGVPTTPSPWSSPNATPAVPGPGRAGPGWSKSSSLAPSDRFTLTPPDGNEMHRECNGTSWATLGHEREFGPDTDPTDPDLTEPPAPALHSTVRTKGVTKREASASQRAPGHTADQDHRGQNARVQLNLPQV